MLYRDPARLLDAALADGLTSKRAFTTPDGTTHQLAKITSPEALRTIRAHARGVPADRRRPSPVRNGAPLRGGDRPRARRGEKLANPTPEHRYFMSFLCNEDDPTWSCWRPIGWFTPSRNSGGKTFACERASSSKSSRWSVRWRPRRAPASRGGQPRALGHRARTAPPSTRSWRSPRAGAWPCSRAQRRPTWRRGTRPWPVVPRWCETPTSPFCTAGILEHVLGISLEAQAQKTNSTYLQRASEGALRLERGGATCSS